LAETTLYLTRHGQTEWNLLKKMQGHQDSPLTELGVLQAEWLHKRLESVSFDAVYSSSSPRALRTAQIVAGNSRGSITQMDELKEINMGLWEGQQIDLIQERYAKEYFEFFNSPHLYQPTGSGETYQELLDRSKIAIDRILSLYQGGNVLIVTHRITLKTILGYYGNKTLEQLASLSDIESTSLSKISIKDDIPSIEMYGDISHYDQ
jgi:probable phosphoglycerate mutase